MVLKVKIIIILILMFILQKVECLTLFEREFDVNKNKLVVIGCKSDKIEGFDNYTTNILLEQFLKRGIPCWTEDSLISIWRQEIYRKMLVNDIQGIAKISSNPFINTWVLKCHIETATTHAIGRYSVSTATASITIVDGNNGKIIKASTSTPMGTPANPGWIGETEESAEKYAIQTSISEAMNKIGLGWWQTPLMCKINLKWGKFEKLNLSEKPNTFVLFENYLIYASQKGTFAVNINTKLEKNISDGQTLTIGIDSQNKKICIVKEDCFEIWKFSNGEFHLEKKVSIIEKIFKLKFSPSGNYICGAGKDTIFLWDKEGKNIFSKKLNVSVYDIAVDENGFLYAISNKEYIKTDGKDIFVLPVEEKPNATWERQNISIGVLSNEGALSVLCIKKLSIDFMSGATAKYVLKVIDNKGNIKEITLPDDPGRTRTPQQGIFLNNSFRFLALSVKYEANRDGYIGILDINTSQILLKKELPKPKFAEMISISPDGKYFAYLLSNEKNIEIYKIE